MADDDIFVELAQHLVRACHVLKKVTERTGSNVSNECVEKAVGIFERFVDPAQPCGDCNEQH